jgi:hypothetical protein
MQINVFVNKKHIRIFILLIIPSMILSLAVYRSAGYSKSGSVNINSNNTSENVLSTLFSSEKFKNPYHYSAQTNRFPSFKNQSTKTSLYKVNFLHKLSFKAKSATINIYNYNNYKPFHRKKTKRNEPESLKTTYITPFTSKALIAYIDVSDRKPFENAITQNQDNGRMSAPFEDDPDFPDDPGDLPVGEGLWIMLLFISIYSFFNIITKNSAT